MTATIRAWHNQYALDKTPYQDGQEIEDKEIIDTVFDLYNRYGVNIMLLHNTRPDRQEEVLIMVDDRKFQQR